MNRLRLRVFIALILLFVCTICHADEWVAPLSVEGTIKVNTNTGERTVSSPYIWLGYDFIQQTESGGILEFLLPALPDNHTVFSAELRLRDVRRTFTTPDINNYTNELIWEAHGYAGDGILSALDFIDNRSISESFTAIYNRDTNGIVSQLSDQGHFTYIDITNFILERYDNSDSYAGIALAPLSYTGTGGLFVVGIGDSSDAFRNFEPLLRIQSALIPEPSVVALGFLALLFLAIKIFIQPCGSGYSSGIKYRPLHRNPTSTKSSCSWDQRSTPSPDPRAFFG